MMRATFCLVPFLSLLEVSFALNLPLTRRASNYPLPRTSGQIIRSRSVDANGSLKNIDNGLYTAAITLGSQNFSVAIDTGSSDLWVGAQGRRNVQLTNSSDVPINLSYVLGSAAGNVNFADFNLGSHNVLSQAFMDANKTKDLDALAASGIDGFMGLSFDQQSQIDKNIMQHWGNNSTAGLSVMSRLFAQNSSLPTFMTFLLGRSGDLSDGVADGVFTVGEYQEGLEAIQNTTRIPHVSKSVMWAVLLDDMQVNNGSMPLVSNVSDTPYGKAVAVLDSGSTQPQLPRGLIDGIYSNMSDAFRDDSDGTWYMQCNSSVNLTFTLGGTTYPVHPLDVTSVTNDIFSDGKNYTFCVSNYQAGDQNGLPSGLDLILGQGFLRNTYSLFDFGNRTSNGTQLSDPFVQLLSTETSVDMQSNFMKSRQQALSQLSPEASISQVKDEVAKRDSNSSTPNSSAGTQFGTPASTSSARPSPSSIGHGFAFRKMKQGN